MQLSLAATLLACTSAVQAFSDSSPFVLFSTAESVIPVSGGLQLAMLTPSAQTSLVLR